MYYESSRYSFLNYSHTQLYRVTSTNLLGIAYSEVIGLLERYGRRVEVVSLNGIYPEPLDKSLIEPTVQSNIAYVDLYSQSLAECLAKLSTLKERSIFVRQNWDFFIPSARVNRYNYSKVEDCIPEYGELILDCKTGQTIGKFANRVNKQHRGTRRQENPSGQNQDLLSFAMQLW